MSIKLRSLLLFFLALSGLSSFAQAPVISYSGPQIFKQGTAKHVAPTSSGVAAFGYGKRHTIDSGFTFVSGIAVDAAGNVYIADSEQNNIYKIPAGGGAQVVLGSGFKQPFGVAADAAGNVYVADSGNNLIKKIPVGGGAIVTLGSGFKDPEGVAVDAAGNVYVTDHNPDFFDGSAKKISVGGEVTTLWNLSGPIGIAADVAGNVYVAETGYHAIVKLPAGGGRVLLNADEQGESVAVDGAGYLYATGDLSGIGKYSVGGTTLEYGFESGFVPIGLAVDGVGNLYWGLQNTVEELKPVGGYYINALPAGLRFDENTGIISGTPTTVSPPTDYTITAYNSTGSTSITVNMEVQLSTTYADLANLQISSGNLTPVFNADTTHYIANATNYTKRVLNYVNSITVTPTTSDPGTTVTVNGAAVTSGSPSALIPLNVGSNTITTVVTARDGVTTKTYELTIIRAGGLVVSLSTGSTLTNSNQDDWYDYQNDWYTASVKYGTKALTVTPIVTNPNATITVNGTVVVSGTASQSIPLTDNPTTITVAAKAPGDSIRTHIILVYKKGSSNAGVNLKLSTGSTVTYLSTSKEVNYYSASVTSATNTLAVIPTASDPGATITVDGTATASGTASQSIALTADPSIITVQVTAPDGVTIRSYSISVYKNGSSNAGVGIKLSTGSLLTYLSTSNQVNYYSASVTAATTALTVTPTTGDPAATITVDGTAVASGTASQSIALDATPTIINVVVTAQDGTTRTHSISVYKNGASDAGAHVRLSTGSALTFVSFSNNVNYYTASVTSGTTSLKVTPTANDPNATIKVDKVTVASGKASKSIALTTDPTVITVQVTAQDGVTTRTFSISVSMAASSSALNNAYIGVSNPAQRQQMMGREISVRQGLSPNGDGINDFLVIENIGNYPDNKLQIMNRSGQLIFEAKAYDNMTKVFDGHSNKTGQMQLPGTYFYSLDYMANGVAQHKTGFIVLKY